MRLMASQQEARVPITKAVRVKLNQLAVEGT